MTNLSSNLLGGPMITLGPVAVCSAAWDTRRVTFLSYSFYGAHAFNSPVASWNTAKVTTFQHVFYNAYAFNQPIGKWDTGNVRGMKQMFAGATSFKQNIMGWNISSVTSANGMFGSDGADDFETYSNEVTFYIPYVV